MPMNQYLKEFAVVAIIIGCVIALSVSRKTKTTHDDPAIETNSPVVVTQANGTKLTPSYTEHTPHESEAMKVWKSKKQALINHGASVKSPDQIWSPIDNDRSAAAFAKLPANVQSNMWNLVFKRQSEVMRVYVDYMRQHNALDAEKPTQ